jgi:hypothetical protein
MSGSQPALPHSRAKRRNKKGLNNGCECLLEWRRRWKIGSQPELPHSRDSEKGKKIKGKIA